MDARQQFKAAFMLRCIEEGFTTPEEIEGRAKLAMEKFAANPLTDVATSMLALGIPLALAAPPVIGAGIGHTIARATDIDDTDVEEARKKELIDEYRRQSAKARRRRMVTDYRSRAGAFG